MFKCFISTIYCSSIFIYLKFLFTKYLKKILHYEAEERSDGCQSPGPTIPVYHLLSFHSFLVPILSLVTYYEQGGVYKTKRDERAISWPIDHGADSTLARTRIIKNAIAVYATDSV